MQEQRLEHESGASAVFEAGKSGQPPVPHSHNSTNIEEQPLFNQVENVMDNGQQAADMPPAYDLTVPEYLTEELQDTGVLERFSHFCASSGFSQEQAQQAVNFYLAEQNNVLQGMQQRCEETLRGRWQGRYEQNLGMAKKACVAMNREMQGRLKPLINAGLGNDPTFAELMAKIGEKISEDSFGNFKGSGQRDESMSTEEFLRKVVFKGK